MKNAFYAVIFCLFAIHTSYAQEVSDTKFGKGLLNFTAKDSSFAIKFAPRIQFRSYTTWDYDGTNYNDPVQAFLIRRARLKFDGWVVNPDLVYKIELGLSNNDISGGNFYTGDSPRYILDAVLKWNFYENFVLWAGQAKLPGNVERVISSGNLQLIDRSILNSRFNIDRDIGLQLHHKVDLGNQFIIKEKLSISQGEGRNVTKGNIGGLQYTGRLELLPFGEFTKGGDYFQADLLKEESPKLMMGFVYDFNDNAVKTRGNMGSYMILDDGSLHQTDVRTIFADAVFKYRGLSIMTEYANRIADDPVALQTDNVSLSGFIVLEGSAFNIQAGYMLGNNYEIAARYTTNNYNDISRAADEQEYTIGASKYIVGHKLKVQTDLTYGTADRLNDGIVFRFGFDFHF